MCAIFPTPYPSEQDGHLKKPLLVLLEEACALAERDSTYLSAISLLLESPTVLGGGHLTKLKEAKVLSGTLSTVLADILLW